ncbi:putative quinone-oxidoreductase, chloroplastic [Ananas comosus]|uniref:Putative quinone-oxidoreductase, chloroplastic n=1 Tax=Ananas comosus TaxID=4615 RepID=A0A199UZ38_ANACO|nr:putative quinone-oxidoreductase, chloroplastic [Ananas comosus]
MVVRISVGETCKHVEVPIPSPKEDEILLKRSVRQDLGQQIMLDYPWPAHCSSSAKFDGTGCPYNILITAASGGVGLFAVQLANFHLTATCGRRNLNLVVSFGADEVLDYKSLEGKTLKSPSGKSYDYFGINCVEAKKHLKAFMLTPNKEDLEFMVEILVKGGRVKTLIDSSYSLSKAQEAWSKSIGGHATGKIIVEMNKVSLVFAYKS